MYQEHLFQTFQALKFVATLPDEHEDQLKEKAVELPRRTKNSKLVVFDLDETLVHCCADEPDAITDVSLMVTFPTGEQATADINVRPYVR